VPEEPTEHVVDALRPETLVPIGNADGPEYQGRVFSENLYRRVDGLLLHSAQALLAKQSPHQRACRGLRHGKGPVIRVGKKGW
jgi:hypothetical protein